MQKIEISNILIITFYIGKVFQIQIRCKMSDSDVVISMFFKFHNAGIVNLQEKTISPNFDDEVTKIFSEQGSNYKITNDEIVGLKNYFQKNASLLKLIYLGTLLSQ